MRNWITFLMTLLVGSTLSYANADAGQVTLEAGYRHDNISTTNRFPSSDPVLKTKTKFKDIDIFQLGLKGRTTLGCNLYLRANAYWGWVLEGDFEQEVKTFGVGSYYDSFNGGFEFTNNNKNVVDDRYVYGAGVAIGYPFHFCDCSVILAPVVGYAIDEQNLSVDDEGFDFSRDDDLVFPVSGDCCCRHKTIFRWYGPFVGVDFQYRPFNQCWNLYAELEYHWGHFKGKRHHHGFDLFDNQNHSANATGWVFAAGADYDLCNCWTVGLSVKFQDWKAHKSHHCHGDTSDAEYLFSDRDGRGRHNNKWDSYAINLTLGHQF